MNVKTLADLTGLNLESIRQYRNYGFLNPKQRKNGYYDYTDEDLFSLLYFRKLRDLHYPVSKIQDVYQTSSIHGIHTIMEEQEQQLQMELLNIQAKLNHLNIAKKHLECAEGPKESNAWPYSIRREKIDVLDLSNLSVYKNHFAAFAPGLHVSKEDLNSPDEEREINMKVCMGAFVEDLTQLQLPIPEQAIRIPAGPNLFQILELTDFSTIHLSQLSGLRNYAKEHNLTFTSDLTGALLNVYKENEHFHYLFTIRACIEPR